MNNHRMDFPLINPSRYCQSIRGKLVVMHTFAALAEFLTSQILYRRRWYRAQFGDHGSFQLRIDTESAVLIDQMPAPL